MTATPDAAAVEAAVLDALAEVGGKPRATLHLDQDIDANIGIDSLDFVRLIQVLEDRLGIQLPDTAVAGVKTVRELVAVARVVV